MRRMRGIIILPLVLAFALTSLVYADPNLVGWWEFEEGSGSDANDSSGYDNHGILVGDTSWVADKIGDYALDFDGDGDYVDVPDDDSLNPSSEITIAFWIYNRGGQDAGIYKYAACPDQTSKGSPGNSRAYIMAISNSTGKLGLSIWATRDNVDSIISNSTISLNEWHHVAGTFNSGAATVYIDGQPDNSEMMSVSSIMNDAHPLIIGGYWEYCTPAFVSGLNGIIDDIRIYDRALSPTEITNLYRLAIAWNPYPPDEQECTEPNVVFTWSPGNWASDTNGHDVYLGTDFNDVNDANTTITLDVYKGRQDANSYDPCGLETGQIYYWRIDEVNDSNDDSPWKGRVWSFETSGPIIELSADYFNFLATEVNGPNPPAQTLSISNSCNGTLNWQITKDCNWLTVEPNSGSSTGESNDVTLSIDITGLVEGIYDCNLTILDPCASNSPQTAQVELAILDECYEGMPDYDEWVGVGRPECWCYPRQCHGDADGKKEGIFFMGYKYVDQPDLDIMALGWKVKDPPMGSGILNLQVNGVPVVCADFTRSMHGACFLGPSRINQPDLDLMGQYWKKKEPPKGSGTPPDCLPGNREPEQPTLSGLEMDFRYWLVDEVNNSNDNLWEEQLRSLNINYPDYPDYDPNYPIIEFSANQFDFFAEVDGPNPPAQILFISNSCTGTLNWQITEDCNWITVEPNSGSVKSDSIKSSEVTLSVNITGLPEGVYDCNLTVSDPYAGNNPQIVHVELFIDISSISTQSEECYEGMPDYDEWVGVGRPECWCYPRQCHGDADGLKVGMVFIGYKYVGQLDLDIMTLGWKVKDPPKGSGILNISVNGVPVVCADFAHDKTGLLFTGYRRIDQTDLDLMTAYWKVKEPPMGSGTPPDCLPGNRGP